MIPITINIKNSTLAKNKYAFKILSKNQVIKKKKKKEKD